MIRSIWEVELRVQSSIARLPRNGNSRVTINDLAEALGIAKGTVSRALNGYSDISDGTKLRVAKQAQMMGYRPLSHAQAIKTGRVKSLGLVLQVNERDGQRPFLTDFLDGVSRQASAENWTLTVATATSDEEGLESLQRLAEERKADGFILPRTKIKDPRVALLNQLAVPFVLYGRTQDLGNSAWFDFLGEDAIEEAVIRLADFGHQRIGFINGGKIFNYSLLREKGYRTGLKRRGYKLDKSLIRKDAVTVDQGYREALSLLRLDLPPTAIICALDMAALGVYQAATETGLDIGRDLSVIAYDGIPEGGYASPPLTTFSVDSRIAGERLAALLIACIRGTEPETLRESAYATLMARGSDGVPVCDSEDLARKIRAATKKRESITC